MPAPGVVVGRLVELAGWGRGMVVEDAEMGEVETRGPMMGFVEVVGEAPVLGVGEEELGSMEVVGDVPVTQRI